VHQKQENKYCNQIRADVKGQTIHYVPNMGVVGELLIKCRLRNKKNFDGVRSKVSELIFHAFRKQ